MGEEKQSRVRTALDAERGATTFKLDPDQIVIVGYDTNDGAEHPLVNERVLRMKREGFDRPDLVQSLLDEGQLQNIIVRKNGKRSDGSDVVECVVGRNRVLAARQIKRDLEEAGQDAVFYLTATLRKDGKGLAGAVEAENNVRRDDDMLTKARNAQRLLKQGYSESQAAIKMGMSLPVLQNHLRVLELSPRMQDAVERGVITATAASTFADLSHEEQDAKILAAEESGLIISVPEARRQKKQRNNARKNGGTKPAASTRGKGIAIGVLRKVYDDEEFQATLDQLPSKALLRWVIGEGSHKSVPGLAACLRRVGELED